MLIRDNRFVAGMPAVWIERRDAPLLNDLYVPAGRFCRSSCCFGMLLQGNAWVPGGTCFTMHLCCFFWKIASSYLLIVSVIVLFFLIIK